MNTMMGGNTAKEALADVKYTADPRGVIMDIHSTSSLNIYANSAHTVAIVVVQGNNPKALLKLSQSATDLDNLLSGQPPTDPAIVGVDRFIVQPLAADTVVMARRAEAQAVLVYAGYFNSTLVQRTRMIEVPVNVTSSGVMVTTYTASPLPMYLSLELGDLAIQSLTIMPGEKLIFPSGDNTTLQGGKINPDPASYKVMPL
jgi:hypothetical protein